MERRRLLASHTMLHIQAKPARILSKGMIKLKHAVLVTIACGYVIITFKIQTAWCSKSHIKPRHVFFFFKHASESNVNVTLSHQHRHREMRSAMKHGLMDLPVFKVQQLHPQPRTVLFPAVIT